MKKKALKFGAVGFLLGCFAYLLCAILVSLRMNTGAIMQIVTFSWFGTACGIAYLFIENVELKPVSQAIGYLVSLTVGMLPLAWVGQWFKHIFIGIFSYIIIVAAVSLLLFGIGLVKLKCDIDEIKEAIGTDEEVNHEEI